MYSPRDTYYQYKSNNTLFLLSAKRDPKTAPSVAQNRAGRNAADSIRAKNQKCAPLST